MWEMPRSDTRLAATCARLVSLSKWPSSQWSQPPPAGSCSPWRVFKKACSVDWGCPIDKVTEKAKSGVGVYSSGSHEVTWVWLVVFTRLMQIRLVPPTPGCCVGGGFNTGQRWPLPWNHSFSPYVFGTFQAAVPLLELRVSEHDLLNLYRPFKRTPGFTAAIHLTQR